MSDSTASKSLCTINLAVALKTPWLVHGNDPGRFGLDATLMRDHNNCLVLPGSLILGRIREAWRAMAVMGLEVPDASKWFGREGNDHALRSRFWVNDLVAEKTDEELLYSTRVTIDEATGAAQNGMLMMAEQTQKSGSEIIFKGIWRAFLTGNEANELETALQAGLLWHSQLGAQRSVGFGELLSANITIGSSEGGQGMPLSGVHARLKLSFDQPICVTTRSRRGNVFESGDIITGGTIKGALASLMNAQNGKSVAACVAHNKLAEHFDSIRITHAFPSGGNRRAAAIPQSLVAVNGDVMDVALLDKQHLINDEAPAFLHDWKGEVWSKVNEKRGWGSTRTHLRVRTAMDEKTRSAKESELFAYQCKVAETGVAWLADISLAGIPESDQDAVWQAIGELLAQGLGPIGKTDAWAKVDLSTDTSSVWPEGDGGSICLMLNTPALLFPASAVADKTPELLALYQAAFSELSGGSLSLSHFYASQSMAGGGYLKIRFGKQQKSYLPYVLTDEGSVFVLHIVDGKSDEAKKCLDVWRSTGLSLPKNVVEQHGADWKSNPYLPQNGFGEIVINAAHGFATPEARALKIC
ncbi:MAG: RAMP superfamily CRISPR-associated protein [Gallionella sp.]|jgi:hypothetical protein